MTGGTLGTHADPDLANVTTAAAWASLKRTTRCPMEDGR
jgi:hypothetical protein